MRGRLPSQVQERIEEALLARRRRGLVRELRTPSSTAVDFSSNDYLGLARPGPFRDFLGSFIGVCGESKTSGSTGSRLLSGQSEEVIKLENTAAEFHGSEKSLFFNSGYDANLSLFSCLPGPEDSIVYDELIHASVHDGMRMSRANSNITPFQHNNTLSLRNAIQRAAEDHRGSVLVCIETVYSMDGDIAPLRRILELCKQLALDLKREIYVIADEAHAGGLFGDNGEGLAVAEGLNKHPNLLARVVTFGKAFGAHGAVILSTPLLVEYLINYARPFIYSTALPPHSIATVRAAYAFAKTAPARQARKMLWERVEFFERMARKHLPREISLPSNGCSPIQGLFVPGNRQCMELSRTLRAKGFDVYPIRSPTVPRGTERIRVIVHTHNTEEEIHDLIKSVANAQVQRSASL